jgi:hypothetical protein
MNNSRIRIYHSVSNNTLIYRGIGSFLDKRLVVIAYTNTDIPLGNGEILLITKI